MEKNLVIVYPYLMGKLIEKNLCLYFTKYLKIYIHPCNIGLD
jgi:hypothetical protein